MRRGGGAAPVQVDAIVPAHDEEALIGPSIVALLAARDHARGLDHGITVALTVVLDACTDRTAGIVQGFSSEVTIVTVDARNVGAARRAGIDAALATVPPRSPGRRWIANTDGDSRVPLDWFVAHAAACRAGVDLLLGTVRPDADDFTPEDRRRWLDAHPPGHLPGNVHGANLGIRAGSYRALGGFAALAEHEDVDLVARARAAVPELRVEATLDAAVTTSGRRIGRTPGGYAAFLAATYGPPPA